VLELGQESVSGPINGEFSEERKPTRGELDASPSDNLNNAYRRMPFPSTDERSEFAAKLGIYPRRVQRQYVFPPPSFDIKAHVRDSGSDPSSRFQSKGYGLRLFPFQHESLLTCR
jgi:hypothetical protein